MARRHSQRSCATRSNAPARAGTAGRSQDRRLSSGRGAAIDLGGATARPPPCRRGRGCCRRSIPTSTTKVPYEATGSSGTTSRPSTGTSDSSTAARGETAARPDDRLITADTPGPPPVRSRAGGGPRGLAQFQPKRGGSGCGVNGLTARQARGQPVGRAVPNGGRSARSSGGLGRTGWPEHLAPPPRAPKVPTGPRPRACSENPQTGRSRPETCRETASTPTWIRCGSST